jgi:hypothetical protein
MTNEQLYLAIGIPMAFNAVLVGILIAYMNAKIDGCNARIDGCNSRIDGLRAEMTNGFAAVNQRFDDMRDLWRAELRRVEEILDARLKHLEERG